MARLSPPPRRAEAARGLRRIALVSALLALVLISSQVPASSAATPADIVATEAYLRAGYQLDRALLANIPASNAAAAKFAAGVGGECHGVLTSAPSEELDPSGPPTPRARGERQRSQLQMNTIQDELGGSFYAATNQPYRAPFAAYASQVASLNWTDPQIAASVRLDVLSLQEAIAPMASDPCSDIRAWAQSGYHVLSPSSKAFQAAQQARESQTVPTASISAMLKPSEGPAAQSLLRRISALHTKLTAAIKPATRAYGVLKRDLGLPETASEESEDEPVIGQGRTRAGLLFVVRRQRKRRARERLCGHAVSVELQENPKRGSISEESICLSDNHNGQLSEGCGRGIRSILTAVAPSVWTVRLKLGNGRTITSKVIRVSARDGGPGGVYEQAIRDETSSFVSLTELDRHGRVVHVVKLSSTSCGPEPKTDSQGPTFVHLAGGTTPAGEEFSIEGMVTHFGHNESSFNLQLIAGARSHNDEASITLGGPPVQPKAFSWSLADECQPHPYSIIYGTLAPPGVSVLVRTPSGLVPLTEVQISASLGAKGTLFYGAFAETPTELVVQGNDGTMLYSESLIAKGREEAEFCEGYVEASG